MSTDAPRVIADMPEAKYHAHPGSLSHSGAKLILPPSCPAKYRWQQDHGRPPKKAWDIGHAAHKLVLGTGPELVLIDRPRWDTNEVKAQLAEIRAAGKVPLKRGEWDAVHDMANAISQHPLASELFNPANVRIEQSLFWTDDATGVARRARLDAWGVDAIVDYKTTQSAEPTNIAKAIYQYRYHMQGGWYLDAAEAVGQPAKRFLLVFQETEPPYLVTVAEPDETALYIGRQLNAQALEIYRDCVESGVWPGYSDHDIELVGLPGWAERDHLNDIERWEQDL